MTSRSPLLPPPLSGVSSRAQRLAGKAKVATPSQTYRPALQFKENSGFRAGIASVSTPSVKQSLAPLKSTTSPKQQQLPSSTAPSSDVNIKTAPASPQPATVPKPFSHTTQHTYSKPPTHRLDAIFESTSNDRPTYSRTAYDYSLLTRYSTTSIFKRSRLHSSDGALAVPTTSVGRLEGFINLGNTCYLNAVLQSLSSLLPFVSDMHAPPLISAPLSDDTFYRALLSVFQEKQSAHGVINPKKVKDAIGRKLDSFAGFSQQDAHEFLTGCLKQLEDELSPLWASTQPDSGGGTGSLPRELDPLQRNFDCALEHTLTCLQCRAVSHKVEMYRLFPLELPDPVDGTAGPSVRQLLEGSFDDQVVDYQCERCGHGRSRSRYRFAVLPRVLVLQLSRFRVNPAKQSYDKLFHKVAIDKTLAVEFACTARTLPPRPFTQADIGTAEPAAVSRKRKEPATPSQEVGSAEKRRKLAGGDVFDFQETEPLSSDIERALEESRRMYEQQHCVAGDDDLDDDLRAAIALSLADQSLAIDSSGPSGAPALPAPDVAAKPALIDDEISVKDASRVRPAPNRHEAENSSNSATATTQPVEIEYRQEPDVEEPPPVDLNCTYHLSSIVTHFGSTVSSGHYICDVWMPRQKCWQSFNDSVVTTITEAEALGEKRAANAYLLFYIHDFCYN